MTDTEASVDSPQPSQRIAPTRAQSTATTPGAEPIDAEEETATADEPLRWGASIHHRHAGRTLDSAAPVLLDHTWAYTPASCLTEVRVIALRVGDGTFVCPLCGLRTS